VLSLSSDTPFGTDPSEPKDKDNKDKEPAFLTEEVPESVLKCLEPKKK
jgi:hypothetical protein